MNDVEETYAFSHMTGLAHLMRGELGRLNTKSGGGLEGLEGGDFVLRGPNSFSTRASRSMSVKVLVVVVVVVVVAVVVVVVVTY